MSTNHLTMTFPLKSPADAQAVAERLPPMMPGMFKAQDTIGTIHYSRLTVLSDRTLLFLADFDGEFAPRSERSCGSGYWCSAPVVPVGR